MMNGLSAGIINPSSEDMMKAWYAYHALMALDENCGRYIARYSAASAGNPAAAAAQGTGNSGNPGTAEHAAGMGLAAAIEKGLRDDAHMITQRMSEEKAPLDIINEELIPALNRVGDGFENGTVFLPQLLMLSLIHI